jgi:hypothetical protein
VSVSWLLTLSPSLPDSKVAQTRGRGRSPAPDLLTTAVRLAPRRHDRVGGGWAVVMARSAPTIPIASASGKPNFTLTEQNWQKIERAYRNSLSSDVRTRILEATRSFVYSEVFERHGEPLRAAIERIESIKKATGNLSRTLAAQASDAKLYADHLVKRHFHDSRLAMQRGDLFQALGGVLTSLSVACNLALKEMSDPHLPGHREGECWDRWIRQLTRIARENELPSAASKGSDKAIAHSPFVLMVAALQDCVPASARRHHASMDALATAIHRARTNKARKVGRRDKKAVRPAQ